MTEYNNKTPRTLSECFSFDNSLLNPTPKTLFKKVYKMRFNFRYSATVLLRLSQYFSLRGRIKIESVECFMRIYLNILEEK